VKLDISLVKEEGYLHARVSSANTAENVVDYLSELRRACVQQDCNAILIEENLAGPRLPMQDVKNIVFWGSHQLPRLPLTIAYLDVNSGHSPANVKFAEALALERGINMRACETLEEARAWLREQIAAERNSAP
jgi:hypothetical protein